MSSKISEEKLAWVKELLQRKPRIKSPEPEIDLTDPLDSLPFDLSEDLYKILQESRLRRQHNMSKKKTNEKNLNISSKNFTLEENVNDLLRSEKKTLNATANDSFLYLEKICDKSVSDPNSTLHNYVSQIKERNQDSTCSTDINLSNNECEAIQRLLSEMDMTSNIADVLKERAKKYKKRSVNLSNNETQLGDIEPPSILWDLTTDDDENISPTKRVDLMRFSTIFEESNFSDDTNNLTFQTANQKSTTYETAHQQSTCYETANETLSKDPKDKELINFDQSSRINESENDTIEILDDSSEELVPDCENKSVVVENNESLNFDNTIITNDSNVSMLNISHEFNDTLEEVEYIMKQGAKNMKQNGAKPKFISDVELKINHPNKQIKTPCKEVVFKKPIAGIQNRTPVAGIQNRTPIRGIQNRTPIPGIQNRTPMPGIPNRILHPKKRFANVISPVGAYINRTPETPIYSMAKNPTVKSLDYGEIARRIQYMPTLPTDEKTNKLDKKNNYECALPKKAYVSANFYNCKDERVPIVIPGGDKIHRYLRPALLPQVIRHDGKAKIDLPKNFLKDVDNDGNSTVDSSLADLSVMSGNVSLFTIKDAQNFASNKSRSIKKFL